MGETDGNDGGPLRAEVLNALKGIACCDYRLGVGEMGLVEDARVREDGTVSVKVVPCCIFGMTRLVTSVKEGLEKIEGTKNVEVDVAWDHVWDRSNMSQEGRQTLQLDLKGMAEKHGLKPWGAS